MARARHMWPSSKALSGQLSISAEMLHRPTNAHPSTEAALHREAEHRFRQVRSRTEAALRHAVGFGFGQARSRTEAAHRVDAERRTRPTEVSVAFAFPGSRASWRGPR